MARKAPGKYYRKGMKLIDIMRMFPDSEAAESWFELQRWGGTTTCPKCESTNIHERKNRKPTPYQCRDCRKSFSVKTDTLMHGSNLDYQVWAIAIYLLVTNLKGVSSMKLHRDLGITQKSAWHLAHRIRETWTDNKDGLFSGPVEVDETYIGGKEGNKHESKKLRRGRGAVGKAAIVGVKDRASNKVSAKFVKHADAPTIHPFIEPLVAEGAVVNTDEATVYESLPTISNQYKHEKVKHSVGEYVREQAHTNGVESFWALLKRGYQGTYHQMSVKHLDRYVHEFSGRHNDRPSDTIDQMGLVAKNLDGKRLPYQGLVK